MTDQPQPNALSDDELIAEYGIAYEHSDDSRAEYERWLALHAELLSRLTRADMSELDQAWEGSMGPAQPIVPAAAPSGQVVVSADAAHLARIALDAFITAGDVDYDWTPYIAARDEFVAALKGADQTVEDTQPARLIGATARHDGEFVMVTLFSWGSEMTVQLKPSQATTLVYELTRAANLATYERWDRLEEDNDVR